MIDRYMEDEMKIQTKDYRVREGEEVDLKKRPTTVEPRVWIGLPL